MMPSEVDWKGNHSLINPLCEMDHLASFKVNELLVRQWWDFLQERKIVSKLFWLNCNLNLNPLTSFVIIWKSLMIWT